MIPALPVVAALGWFGCAAAEAPGSAGPTEQVQVRAAQEDDTVSSVTIEVRTAEDFTAAEAAVSERGIAGEAVRVEIVLAAGTYGGRTLQLDAQDGPVDVVVRGVGDVWLDGAGIEVRARDVTVEGLSFRGRPPGFALRIEVERAVALGDLRFTGLALPTDPRAGRVRRGLAELVAAKPGVTASLTRWQVVDSGVPEAGLVQVGVQPGGRWATVRVDGWQVARVTGAALLLTSAVDAVAVVGSTIALPEGAVLLHAAATTTTLALERDVLVLDGPAALGTVAPGAVAETEGFVRGAAPEPADGPIRWQAGGAAREAELAARSSR